MGGQTLSFGTVHMKIVFQDPTFSLQLLRTISETYYKGADIGVFTPFLSIYYHLATVASYERRN
jgi:hypothetical protein